jgi:tetratricopeptide (TPR) repeat protein
VPDKHGMVVVTQICRLVEGMPLAIELAAGWVDTLGVTTIAAELAHGLDLLATELRNVPARHRSMRTVFDATWHRLGAAERMLFARLAIFRGGSDRQAVQEVTGATLLQLRTLVGASLMYYDSSRDRYSVHELLRQYGLEKLTADPAEERVARDRHAVYYCAFVHQRGAELSGSGQQAALTALERERDNIRAAWDWAASNGQIELLAKATDGLGYFYAWRAFFDDGARAYHTAAAQLKASAADENYHRRVLSRLHAWHGNFRRLQGDAVSAEQLLRQGLSLVDTLSASGQEAPVERAFLLLQLGIVASQGQLVEARHAFEESLALYEALGLHWEASHVLMWWGELARQEGAFDEACRNLRASLAIHEVCGDKQGIADVLDLNSQVAAEIGQLDEAEALTRQSYAIRVELGDAVNRAAGLGRLGLILLWAGKYDQASTPLTESLALYQELGDRTAIAEAQWRLAIALRNLGDYDAAWELNQQATRELRQQGPRGLAQTAWNAGTIALARGTHRDVELLLQESVELCRQHGYARDLGWTLPLLGYTHWLLGDGARAQVELLDVIRTTAGQHELMPLLFATLAIAVMLAEQGEKERAVELYALAWRYPFFANSQNCIDMFGRRLDAVVIGLPPEIAQAAQVRGLSLDLFTTARELLVELSVAWNVAAAELGTTRSLTPANEQLA